MVHPADKTDQQKEQRPGNKPREDRRRPGSTHPRLTKQRGPADTAALHPQRGTHHPRHKAPTRGHSNYSATPAGLRATAHYPLSITTPPAAAGRHPQGDPSPSTPFHPLPKPHNNTEHPTPAYTSLEKGMVRYRLQLYLTAGHTPLTYPPILPWDQTCPLCTRACPLKSG